MYRSKPAYFTGCLVGGAVGDALGAPVEFMSLSQIIRAHGPQGLTGYAGLTAAGKAEFTDDTQMTLFTAEGLLQAKEQSRETGIWDTPGMVHRAYLRWYQTQTGSYSALRSLPENSGQLIQHKALWKRKAPGNTCLSALNSGVRGTIESPLNNSKGCGGIMRVAPCGLLFQGKQAFEQAALAAALTHGHPSGYLSAGFLGQLLAEIIASDPEALAPLETLLTAIEKTCETLVQYPGHAETLSAVNQALALWQSHQPPAPLLIESLGGAWVGEEALAISLYCSLSFPNDFRSALLLSVNYSGDSDSTGAITGNISGALLGIDAVPDEWLGPLELRDEIYQLACRFLEE